jgi:hypothetical protein
VRGGEKRRERARRPTPFEVETGEAREEWGSQVRCRMEEQQSRGGGGLVTWTGTAWTRQLQAAPTAVGGARLAGEL